MVFSCGNIAVFIRLKVIHCLNSTHLAVVPKNHLRVSNVYKIGIGMGFVEKL